MTTSVKVAAISAVLTCGMAVGSGASGQTEERDLGYVLAQRMQANDANAQAQDKVDQLDDERREVAQQYRQVLREIEATETYLDQIETLIADQEDEMADIRDQLDRVGDTERDVIPLMVDMVDHYEDFVKADIPFLYEERLDRVRRLRETMNQSGVPTSEKFRLIMEAYQIELDYGRTMEAYEGTLGPDSDRTVEFLRAGRTMLIYRTLDESEFGYYDKKAKEFKSLSGRYKQDIDNAIKVAREQAAPVLLVLPAFAPAEGNASGEMLP